MKKTSLYLLALALTACGGNTNQNSETAKHAHSHQHQHGENDEIKVPDLPAVPENASVYFVNLQDGDVVKSPVFVEFGVEGMEVEAAGKVTEGSGHHHIIINGDFIESMGVVPADDVNIHYGKGQTSDSLTLTPGEYTLTMQFADGLHRSYGEQMSAKISIVVEE